MSTPLPSTTYTQGSRNSLPVRDVVQNHAAELFHAIPKPFVQKLGIITLCFDHNRQMLASSRRCGSACSNHVTSIDSLLLGGLNVPMVAVCGVALGIANVPSTAD